MADVSSDGADRPASDPASYSDEEEYVSSRSTGSAEPEPDALAQRDLPTALDKLHLQQAVSKQSSDHSVTGTSTPGTGASAQTAGTMGSKKIPLQLLDLPLDVLKCIIKEV